MFATMADSDFFRSAGISIELLQQPLGIYSFLTSFFMLAAGVFGPVSYTHLDVYKRQPW